MMMPSQHQQQQQRTSSISTGAESQSPSYSQPQGIPDEENTVASCGDNADNHREEEEPEQKLAESETKAVRFSKTMVLLVLITSCAVAATLTYVFTRQGMEDDFATEFNSIASEMIEVTKHNSETVFDVIRQFSVTTTSFALYNRQQHEQQQQQQQKHHQQFNHSQAEEEEVDDHDDHTLEASFTDYYELQEEFVEGHWPFTTLPDFEARSSVFREVTRAQFLALLPMVWPKERETWGAYSVAHQSWIQESRQYNELHGGGLHHSDHGTLGHQEGGKHHDDHHDEEEGHHYEEEGGHPDEHMSHEEDHDGHDDVLGHHEDVDTHHHEDEHSEGDHSEEHSAEEMEEGHHEAEPSEGDHHEDHAEVIEEGHHHEEQQHSGEMMDTHHHDNEHHSEEIDNSHHEEHLEEAMEEEGHHDGEEHTTEETDNIHHDHHYQHDDNLEEMTEETHVVEEQTGGMEGHHNEHTDPVPEATVATAEEHSEGEENHSGHLHLRRRLEDDTDIMIHHGESHHDDGEEHHGDSEAEDYMEHHHNQGHDPDEDFANEPDNEGHHIDEHHTDHSSERDHHNGEQEHHGDEGHHDEHRGDGHHEGHHGGGHHAGHHAAGPTRIPEHIYRFENSVPVPENSPSFAAPLWQAGPVPPDISLVNFNMLSIPLISRVFNSVLESRLPVLSEVLDLTEVFSEAGSQAFVEHLHGEEAGEIPHPESLVLQPIFQDFGEDPEIKGALLVALPWNVFFDNLLSERASVVCVVKNKCGQVFSYRIEGQESYFLGRGDMHDTKFDKYERVTDFTEFDNVEFRLAHDANHTAEYHAVDHDDVEAAHAHEDEHHAAEEGEHDPSEEANHHGHLRASEQSTNHIQQQDHATVGSCDYSLHIYPTQELEEKHESNKPLLYSLAVVLFFGFTSMIFITYDCLVERRQKKVLTSANKTGAIVQSLFPKIARDQMFEEESESCSNVFIRKSVVGTAETLDVMTEARPVGIKLRASKPIANLFPETTVFFADLAGFTSFSATRTPVEVFTLLETIYNAFDDVAKRRRVFKVETIGDCYVAVTGLPYPQKNHAIVMARFAHDCLRLMGDCTHSLIDVLGEDTANLKLRVGMHSGPTTGGVLRGEKGRFQLFGDTVNTASRMESNGTPGRIQVSETTADLLVAAGKSSWITPREDKINAKGKGTMSTWWLVVKADKSCDNTTISRTDSVVSGSGYDQAALEKIFAEEMMTEKQNHEDEQQQTNEQQQQKGEQAVIGQKEQALVDGMTLSCITEC